MLLLYAILFFSALVLTLVVAHIKVRRIQTLINKHHEKEKAKSQKVKASKKGSDKDGTAT